MTILKDVRFFDVLVGYFRLSGFHLLYPALSSVEKIRILIGLGTEKKVIDILDEIDNPFFESHKQIKDSMQKNIIKELEQSPDSQKVDEGIRKFIEYLQSGKMEIRAHPSRQIHAKLYISRYKEGDKEFGSVITGSSNFSQAGLSSNFEFNVQLKNRYDVEYALDRFEKLWEESVNLSDMYISTVQTKTYLTETVTPYQMFLKLLYEYFKEDLSLDRKVFYQYIPPDFKKLAYQEQAVINAKKILNEHGGVFLSDVVGLGKTYIAALLASQIGGKHLVIASPSLLDENNPHSWRNVFRGFNIPVWAVSVGKLDRILEEGTDKYDNVFIDEAHKFRNESTITYEKLSRICAGKKVILVTATPLNNGPDDILAQIKLFQKPYNSTIPGIKNLQAFFSKLSKRLKKLDRKENKEQYMEVVKENSQTIRNKILKYLMVRRTRHEIETYFKKDLKKQGIRFPEVAQPEPLYYKLNAVINEVFQNTIKKITDKNTFSYARYTPLLYLKETLSEFEQTSQRNMGGFMKVLLVKRLESSFFAFRQTIQRFISSYEKFIKAFEKGVVFFSKKHWDKIIEYFFDDDYESIQRLIDEDKAQQYSADEFTDDFLTDLKKDLKVLQDIHITWEKIQEDPKLNSFIEAVNKYPELRKNKFIIFTESRETAEYLHENISKKLGERCLLYYGNSGESELRKVIDNFDANANNPKNDYRILITTEVLSEGINLHQANVVVNYDIPWNPTRMIQRVGRINRIDTTHKKIYTFNFFPSEQGNDLIKLKELAIAKIQYFIEMLGNDARLLTDGEEIKSFELFEKINSKEYLTGEEEEDTELKYFQIIRDIQEKQPELFAEIRTLPKKIRVARENDEKFLITYFRKGKLEKFFKASQHKAEEIDFMEAASLFETEDSAPSKSLTPDFYELLHINKKALQESLKESENDEETSPRGSRNYGVKILKILKSKEMKLFKGFTEADEEYIKKIRELLETGQLPKTLLKNVVKSLDTVTEPDKVVLVLKQTIPENFFAILDTHKSEDTAHQEVILSEFFYK